MKYTFVGDIHGKVEQVERALDTEGQIIFVGDFLDSRDRSLWDQEKCLSLVCDAIKLGKARAIFGNHELSYLFPQHRCSGWNAGAQTMMGMYANKIEYLFEPIIKIENWLITHAGITKKLHLHYGEPGIESLFNFIKNDFLILSSPVHFVGRARGGLSPFSGIFWCDFHSEFVPIPGINQIFGHTRNKGIQMLRVENSENYGIDFLDNNATDSFLSFEI